jgi:Immunoglobulin I-set domain
MFQESMHTLENFVKRNRSLFPEDIIIYQHIVFYLLDAAELKRLGMKPDAEVYGVKVRERLVAPYGTDVAAILKRYYSKHSEVEIEYLEREDIRRKLREEMGEGTEEDVTSKRRRRYRTDIEETTETETETRLRRDKKQQKSPSAERRRHGSVDRKLQIEEQEMVKRRGRQLEETAPQFTTKLQSKRVRAGDMVRLHCSVTGNPEPEVTWYHGNQPIVDNGRHVINVSVE